MDVCMHKSLQICNITFVQVRRQLEELLNKNGELSRTNTDLRHRVQELEFRNKEIKDKVSTQKLQIEHLNKIKKKQEDSMDSLVVSIQKNVVIMIQINEQIYKICV